MALLPKLWIPTPCLYSTLSLLILFNWQYYNTTQCTTKINAPSHHLNYYATGVCPIHDVNNKQFSLERFFHDISPTWSICLTFPGFPDSGSKIHRKYSTIQLLSMMIPCTVFYTQPSEMKSSHKQFTDMIQVSYFVFLECQKLCAGWLQKQRPTLLIQWEHSHSTSLPATTTLDQNHRSMTNKCMMHLKQLQYIAVIHCTVLRQLSWQHQARPRGCKNHRKSLKLQL